MKKIKHDERRDKYQPALELVEKTFRFIGIPILNQQSRAHDAQAIRGDGNGNRGQRQQDSYRDPAFHKIAIDHRKRCQ